LPFGITSSVLIPTAKLVLQVVSAEIIDVIAEDKKPDRDDLELDATCSMHIST
jgi:hypothetical protein